ncbi:MAG: hypothetical protein V1847_02380 [Candidatus Diapherotrites archaeon]
MRGKPVLLALLLLSSIAFAISSQEALQFAQSGQWIYANETPEIFSTSPLQYGNSAYWVIALLQSNTVSGYLAVLDKSPPQLLSKKSSNLQVFRAGAFLRGYQNLKSSAVQQGQWIFSSTQSGYFNTLKQLLQNEIDGDLSIIENDGNSLEVRAQAILMQNNLKDIQSLCGDASSAIDDAIESENDFLSAPAVEKVDSFHSKLVAVQPVLDSLEAKAIAYDGLKKQLTNLLSKSTMESSQKSYLISLAEPPQQLYSIYQGSSNKKGIGLANTTAVNDLLDSAQASASNAADGLDLRVQRASAYIALYGDNNSLRKVTENKFSSLSQFADSALSTDNKDLWVNQSQLEEFQSNWNKATAAYSQNKYADAVSFAAKAVTNAGNVYRDGFTSTVEPEADITPFLYGAGILVVILVAIYVLQNKDKFFKTADED